MSNAEEIDTSISLSWIVIFLLLALGLGAAAILFIGGNLVAGSVAPTLL